MAPLTALEGSETPPHPWTHHSALPTPAKGFKAQTPKCYCSTTAPCSDSLELLGEASWLQYYTFSFVSEPLPPSLLGSRDSFCSKSAASGAKQVKEFWSTRRFQYRYQRAQIQHRILKLGAKTRIEERPKQNSQRKLKHRTLQVGACNPNEITPQTKKNSDSSTSPTNLPQRRETKLLTGPKPSPYKSQGNSPQKKRKKSGKQ